VALFRAQWTADGSPAAGTPITEFNSQPVNAFGYPLVGATVTTASGGNLSSCSNIWENLLQSGRPTLTTGNVISSPYANSSLVSYGTTFFVAASGTTCYYIYTARGQTFSAPVITYNSISGEVDIDTSL
jgi:hypothetical protein